MKVALLTSSRADYGIYLPLIKKLESDDFFDLDLIVFGTHLSKSHGYSLNQIIADGFTPKEKIETAPELDNPENIGFSMSQTLSMFSKLWANSSQKPDIVIVLGDRYEMFAAVGGTVPTGIPIIHLHGGETTPNAIDNKYRDAITALSDYHFASTAEHANRVKTLVNNKNQVFNVGALSLDNLEDLNLYSIEEFKIKYHIDMSLPTALFTFHPETASREQNHKHIAEIKKVITKLNQQVVITMPNADVNNLTIRNELNNWISEFDHIKGVDNFGTLGYFSCMAHCQYVIGNSSSGIIETPSFKKYFINLGNRQKGRQCDRNVINCRISEEEISNAVVSLREKPKLTGTNIYWKGNVSDKIIYELKKNTKWLKML